jgi:hypothetical protein
VGLNTLISGFNSTALFKLNREIALGKLAIFELGGQISSPDSDNCLGLVQSNCLGACGWEPGFGCGSNWCGAID